LGEGGLSGGSKAPIVRVGKRGGYEDDRSGPVMRTQSDILNNDPEKGRGRREIAALATGLISRNFHRGQANKV